MIKSFFTYLAVAGLVFGAIFGLLARTASAWLG